MMVSLVEQFSDTENGIFEVKTPVFPTIDAPNPGDPLREFHLKTLAITDGVEVHGRGQHPLIIRLAGPGRDGSAIVFLNRGILDCNGEDGGDFDGLCPPFPRSFPATPVAAVAAFWDPGAVEKAG
jgi:hypothetical protein